MSLEKAPSTNSIGREKKDYMGAKSTLCTGCGHDSVTNHLISALFQSGVNPFKVAKMSGIGCSSKTPTYFLEKSHGFNSIHGRMAPVATGAKVVNPELITLGISGDGDTASIGFGGFAHMIRRNLPIVYIIENNGVYGLTKGQFSATADQNSTQKSGEQNPFTSIDICSLAIDLGCDFVARSFSGDAKQLIPIIDAALRHNGTAVIDVVSPCITFANHEGSTKSFNAVKAHNVQLQELGFIQPQEEIKVDYAEGTTQVVELSDGSRLLLTKIDSRNFDLRNRAQSIEALHRARAKCEILTGLFYFNPASKSLIDILHMSQTPLVSLNEKDLKPTQSALDEMMAEFS
jgi:2-oxoglutarate ferredoxin oxidoreductase subunit beta